MAKDGLPPSRWSRAARVGRLAAGQAARQLGTRAANVTRDDEERAQALERRHIETAEQIVAALGTMKGAAMKLGQVMSFLDVGLVPEEHREEFQAELAKLRDRSTRLNSSHSQISYAVFCLKNKIKIISRITTAIRLGNRLAARI